MHKNFTFSGGTLNHHNMSRVYVLPSTTLDSRIHFSVY